AKNKQLTELETKINELFASDLINNLSAYPYLSQSWQQAKLSTLIQQLATIIKELKKETYLDALCSDLETSYKLVKELSGKEYNNDLLDIIFIEEKYNNFRNVCRAARQEIKNKIEEAKMEIAEVFADGEYFDLQPQYCFSVYECRDSQQLSGCEKQINDLIQTLANISEEARKEKERIARETTQEKQEQAKKEREKQQKKKTDKNNQDRQAEKLQEEIDKKVEELQNKLRDLENSGGTDNPSSQREKEDLNKQLWDLKMDDLTKKSP
ncbi:8917_t:CDS:2, partial [Funneliformis geosporum]